MAGVQSIARVMAVLERLSLNGAAGVTELSRDLKLAPPTVQRLLGALVDSGLVEQNPADRSYRVTVRLFQWGQAPIRRLGVREVAKPFMQELAAEIGETIALGVLDGTDVMHVEWIPARHLVQPRVAIGDRVPAYFTALGQSLLAWLPADRRAETLKQFNATEDSPGDQAEQEKVLQTVREQGYAIVFDPRVNVCTLAAPIWGSEGMEPIGTIGVGGPATRFTTERAQSLAPRLLEASVTISSNCGSTLDVLRERKNA